MGGESGRVVSRSDNAAKWMAQKYAASYRQGKRQATPSQLKDYSIGDSFLRNVYLPRNTTEPFMRDMGSALAGIHLLDEVERSWGFASSEGAVAYDPVHNSILFPICSLSIKGNQTVPEIAIIRGDPDRSMGKKFYSPVVLIPSNWIKKQSSVSYYSNTGKPLSHPEDDDRVEGILRSRLREGE